MRFRHPTKALGVERKKPANCGSHAGIAAGQLARTIYGLPASTGAILRKIFIRMRIGFI
jgi:hypothetical protein